MSSRLNSRLLTRPFNLPDDWEARWCDSTDRYEFHNSVTDVTELNFPTPSVTTLGFSYPWKISGISGGPHETTTPAVLDLLTRVHSNTYHHYAPGKSNIRTCIHGLRGVYGYGNVDYGHISIMFADLVAAIEDDRRMISRQHRSLVDFLYAKLKDARMTIEKLTPADSIVEELYHADVALPINASENPISDVSQSAKLGNISSSSPLTIDQQSLDLEPSQSHHLTSSPRSLIHRPTRAESDPIQAHEPEGDAPNNTQGNLDSTKEIFSARKRKRKSTKDPIKFKHECDTCGERFTRSTTLREHSRTHTNERPFPCSICPKTLARKKDKIRHENLHLGERTFYCRLDGQDPEGGCGRCFTREDGLVAHLRTERGWKCLQDFLASTFCQTYIENHLRHGNGFRCELTQRSCHGDFNDLSDLKDHLQDIANRQCATQWLTETLKFLRYILMNRSPRRFQDTDSGASDAERLDSSRHPTPQDRQEPSASAPDDSRLPNDTLVLSSDAAEAVDLPSPARRVIRTARHNETVDIDQATTVSRLRDGIQSTEASASDFDPFASWYFSSNQRYWTSQNCKLEIPINCTQKWPKSFYLTIGDKEIIPNVLWSGSISGGFRAMLTIHCGLMICSLSSQVVSMVYHSDQSTKKKFLGTLNYGMSPQPTPANAEAIGDEVTSIEKSPSALPGNNHQAEQSSPYGEIGNNQTQPVNEAISQSASIKNSNIVSDWKIGYSYFFSTASFMTLRVSLDYPGGIVPNPLTSALFFDFTELESEFLADGGSTMVQAMCSPSPLSPRDVYDIHRYSSIYEWYWVRPVAVHLHFRSADLKLFVGTRRYNLEGQLDWHQASPRETCPCSSCA